MGRPVRRVVAIAEDEVAGPEVRCRIFVHQGRLVFAVHKFANVFSPARSDAALTRFRNVVLST